MAEIVRRRSWGGVLPLGRHVSISGSRSIHAPSVSIAPSSFQEEQNARHHKQFKLEQALIVTGSSPAPVCCGIWYQGERHPPPLPFDSGPSRILTGIGMLLLNAPRRRQRAPRSHEALLMRARRNAGMTEQRLALAPQATRTARRTSWVKAGSPTRSSSIIWSSASTTARQTAAPQRTVKRRRPASAPLPCLDKAGHQSQPHATA